MYVHCRFCRYVWSWCTVCIIPGLGLLTQSEQCELLLPWLDAIAIYLPCWHHHTHTHTHFPSLSAAFISLGSVVFWQWGGIFGLGAQSLTVFVALFWTLSCECICVVFATRIKGLLQFNCCLSFGFLYLRAPLSLRSLGCVLCISCPDVRSVCSAVSCVRGGFLLRSYN